MTTSSRMTYAFARYALARISCSTASCINNLFRDGGLPVSRFFAKVHPQLDLPLNALYLTVILVVVFGCIFLGSSRYSPIIPLRVWPHTDISSAFNAIISASVVALGVSYGIPIAINCIRGRKMLPESRPFKLGGLFGWTANLVCLGVEQYYQC